MIPVTSRLAGTAVSIVGALVLLSAGACGGAASTPEPPSAVGGGPTAAPVATTAAADSPLPDLCNRLTTGAVADAAGVDIPLVRPEPGPGIISCAYHLRNDDASPAIYVQYQRNAATSLDFTNSGEEITGVGERAKWYQRGAKLQAKVNGDDLLIVNLGVSNKNLRGGDLRSLAVDLATRALAQLRG